MIFARCKPNKSGILILGDKLHRVKPGWTGLVPRDLYLANSAFLEPAEDRAQEVPKKADPFRRGHRCKVHGQAGSWSARAA
jgi:hypothetical protein